MKIQLLIQLLPFLLATAATGVAAAPEPAAEPEPGSILEKRAFRYRCDDDFSQRCGAMMTLNRGQCRRLCSCPGGRGVADCQNVGRGCSGADVKRICSQRGDCECRFFDNGQKCRKKGGMTVHLCFPLTPCWLLSSPSLALVNFWHFKLTSFILSADCLDDLNSCCSKLCTQDRASGSLKCQWASIEHGGQNLNCSIGRPGFGSGDRKAMSLAR